MNNAQKMIIIKKLSIIMLMSMFALSSSALTRLPVVELLGNRYYVYEVKKGDSLYGIAKLYGWDTSRISKFNPQAAASLEKGMKIYYPVSEQKESLPVPSEIREIKPEQLSHLVKRGETVYSISKMYGIPIETIYRLNPSSREGIKAGEIILLAEKGKNQDNKEFLYYEVKSGDTLYGVSKRYGTTVRRILDLNPGISEKKFRSGITIKIPAEIEEPEMITETVEEEQLASFNIYKVKKGDTWESVSAATGIDVDKLKKANPGITNLKKNEHITIPEVEKVEVEREVVFVDPRENTPEGRESLYKEVNGISSDSLTYNLSAVFVMTEPETRKDIEFARGFIAGLDKMKSSGLPITFRIIDGSMPEDSVRTEISESNPGILFVTSDKSIPGFISEYAQINKVPFVNVFDVKNEFYLKNPYLIQYLTPSNYFNEATAKKIAEEFNGRTVLFVGNDDEERDLLSDMLRESMTDSPVISLSLSELDIYPFINENNYLIYAFPTRKNDVTQILDLILSGKEQAPLADIAVVGRPNWITYEDGLKEKFHKANVYIPSRFFLDLESGKAKNFISDYKKIFEKGPMKSYPLYAGVGYDVANYFLPEMVNNKGDINAAIPSEELLQCNINLKRVSNWSGMYNSACYLVRFTPFETIETILLK